MSRHVVILTDQVREGIQAAVRFAFAHPLLIREIQAAERDVTKDREMAQRQARSSLVIPPSTWCCFTVERHPEWTRHLSIVLDPSVHRAGAGPDPMAVEFILQLFGFEHTHIERFPDDQLRPEKGLMVLAYKRPQFSSVNFFEHVSKFPKFPTL